MNADGHDGCRILYRTCSEKAVTTGTVVCHFSIRNNLLKKYIVQRTGVLLWELLQRWQHAPSMNFIPFSCDWLQFTFSSAVTIWPIQELQGHYPCTRMFQGVLFHKESWSGLLARHTNEKPIISRQRLRLSSNLSGGFHRIVLPSKFRWTKTLTQCWFNVGPTSKTGGNIEPKKI